MRKLLVLLSVTALLFCGYSCKTTNGEIAIKPWAPSTERQLVWADEFDGNALNTDAWEYETKASGWSQEWNNELQDFKNDGAGGENLYVSDGSLHIKALKVDERNTFNSYTSARICTYPNLSWKYGRISARIKLPYGSGIWPAFWMLGDDISSAGWPGCGEIDILEMVGGAAQEAAGFGDGVLQGALHGPGYSGGQPLRAKYILPSGKLADDFHVYEIEWNEQGIAWYFDGIEYLRVLRNDVDDWVFDHNFYIILNLAIGGNWPGSPNAQTVFPQTMEVDWVRVYQ